MTLSPLDMLPAAPAALALIAALLAVAFVRTRERGARQNSPFADDFTRAPGHKLRRQVEAAYRSLWRAVLFTAVWPLLVYAAWAGAHLELGIPRSMMIDVGASVLLVIGFGWILLRLLRAERHCRGLRLALDAEISTGQTLTSLLGHGCRLVHDVGVPGGRIAHVLVMPSGVHAVRTVACLRRGRGSGRDDVTAHFTGDELHLPGRTDIRSVPLARKHARLLSERLGEALGHGVQVRSAVALPGWRVEQPAGSDVRVFNPREAGALLSGPVMLSAAEIKEIAGVLEGMAPVAPRPSATRDPVLDRKEPRLE
jgi:hypothetical protein